MKSNRRKFLKGLGGVVGAGLVPPMLLPEILRAAERSDASSRLRKAQSVHARAAELAFARGLPKQKSNGEEKDYPYIASYSKGLPHNALGEVSVAAYKKLLKAVNSRKQSDFEEISISDKRLKNPMAGLSFELEGCDPQQFALPPAPRIDDGENSAEMAELYWEALCRDISFNDFSSSSLIAEAAADLSRFSKYKGPSANGSITAPVIFRGVTAGDLIGPYVSQYLLLDVPIGVRALPGQKSSGTLSQKYRTTIPAKDYLTDYGFWAHRNDGGLDGNVPQYDTNAFYIRNGRDLASAVQIDIPFHYGVNALYLLLALGVPYASGNPYRSSLTMDSFATFGYPHIFSMIAEAGIRAARAVWYSKWFVHRRFRPETFGGRIHNHLRGAANYTMIDSEILNSSVLPKISDHNLAQNNGAGATYLLPQAYPEGAPLHPAYASGRATMIGAAVTILKAFFDEGFQFPNPVVVNSDASAVVPYEGPDAPLMTVGGELNKLASNIALGRNWAGIHWRSDALNGMKMGEAVAIQLLKETSITLPERHSFAFTTFAGGRVSIRKR